MRAVGRSKRSEKARKSRRLSVLEIHQPWLFTDRYSKGTVPGSHSIRRMHRLSLKLVQDLLVEEEVEKALEKRERNYSKKAVLLKRLTQHELRRLFSTIRSGVPKTNKAPDRRHPLCKYLSPSCSHFLL